MEHKGICTVEECARTLNTWLCKEHRCDITLREGEPLWDCLRDAGSQKDTLRNGAFQGMETQGNTLSVSLSLSVHRPVLKHMALGCGGRPPGGEADGSKGHLR